MCCSSPSPSSGKTTLRYDDPVQLVAAEPDSADRQQLERLVARAQERQVERAAAEVERQHDPRLALALAVQVALGRGDRLGPEGAAREAGIAAGLAHALHGQAVAALPTRPRSGPGARRTRGCSPPRAARVAAPR